MKYNLKFKCRICGSVFNGEEDRRVYPDEINVVGNEPVPWIVQKIQPVWHKCFVGFIPENGGPIGIADFVGLQPIPEPQKPQE